MSRATERDRLGLRQEDIPPRSVEIVHNHYAAPAPVVQPPPAKPTATAPTGQQWVDVLEQQQPDGTWQTIYRSRPYTA